MRRGLRTFVVSGLVVHVIELGLAALVAAPLASFLAWATGELGADVTGSDAYLEALVAASRGHASGVLYGFAAAGALTAVLHAPVQMVWLHSLAGSPPRAALRAGSRRVPSALAVTFLVYAAGVLSAALALCPAIAAHIALREHANVRLHDLVVLAMAAPFPIALYVVALMHDLGRSALVRRSLDSLGAIRAGARALGPRLALEYGGFLVMGGLFAALALAASFVGGTAAEAALAIAAAHALLFARTLLRGAWLARCVAATRRDERA